MPGVAEGQARLENEESQERPRGNARHPWLWSDERGRRSSSVTARIAETTGCSEAISFKLGSCPKHLKQEA